MDNISSEALEERLNRIKQNINEDEIPIELEDPNNKSLDINQLKNKVKMDNAPELKTVKNLRESIKQIKSGFEQAKNSTVNKEKFLNFIKQANEMSKNYEKQLEYYSMYSGKYNSKDLSISNNITKFFISSDKRKVFENEINNLNFNVSNPDIQQIQKVYKEKIDFLFKENKNLNKVIEKMSNEVITSFQNKIQDLYVENTRLKTRNKELEEKFKKIKFIYSDNNNFSDEMNEKET